MTKSLLLLLLSVCTLFVHAQDQTPGSGRGLTIRGTVREKSTGQAIPGVQVTQQSNPGNVVVAGAAGEFTITVPSGNAVLLIHAMGYADMEVPVAGRSLLTIDLEAGGTSNLDEIIVVGAVVKRHDLTGSVATIDAKTISITPTADINTAIQGKVAGAYVVNSAQPGTAASIKIRGNNSLSYGTSPIFVVDGVIVGDNLNALNPDDIASMEVLKDASATAIYGSRGANGVVIVSTKRGRRNTAAVNYNSWITW